MQYSLQFVESMTLIGKFNVLHIYSSGTQRNRVISFLVSKRIMPCGDDGRARKPDETTILNAVSSEP
jgi:hypothetical protein